MVHHGDEEVEQDDDVDDGEGAEHDQAPEPRELLDPRQLKVVEVYQAKSGPEQSLTCLPQAEIQNLNLIYPARARSARARRACALSALGLLLADGAPTVGGGKTF